MTSWKAPRMAIGSSAVTDPTPPLDRWRRQRPDGRGAGDTDQLIFIANDANNLLQLYGGGLSTDDPAGIFPPQTLENSTRAIFELNAGQVFLNTGDMESVYIDALGGDGQHRDQQPGRHAQSRRQSRRRRPRDQPGHRSGRDGR